MRIALFHWMLCSAACLAACSAAPNDGPGEDGRDPGNGGDLYDEYDLAPLDEGVAGEPGGPEQLDDTGEDGSQNRVSRCNGNLTGRVRDFHYDFPDMEPAHSGKCDACDDRGMVRSRIGPDQKPTYAGPPGGTVTTTGPHSFSQWFRDVDGVNLGRNIELGFVDPDGDGVFTYDNQSFFPIDGELFGNEPPEPLHNFHFTYELHTEFIYRGGERFTFIGDDDVFTFIDGVQVVDLGGIHGPQPATVVLDDLGLEPGETYQLDFFFAERHVTGSHFRIDTTIEFIDCGTIIK